MWYEYDVEEEAKELKANKELFLKLFELNDLIIIGSSNRKDWCKRKQEFIIKKPKSGYTVEYTFRSISSPELVFMQNFNDLDCLPGDFIVFKHNWDDLEYVNMEDVFLHPEVYDRQTRVMKIDMVLNHPTKT